MVLRGGGRLSFLSGKGFSPDRKSEIVTGVDDFGEQGETVRTKFGNKYGFTKLKAFTLAEVLITLGIIGVVAAMTLPTLVQNHRKQVVEARLKKFYSIMNQAVKMSELKHGEFMYWGSDIPTYDNDAIESWYNTYFRPYVKTTKIEAKGGVLSVYLADGSKFKLFNHILNCPEGQVCSANALHLYFYPNGNSRTDIHGKDYFTFFMNAGANKKWAPVEPYKFLWDGTPEQLYSSGIYACKRNNTEVRHYCTAIIQYNGWKIPDDYPFKF